jgi:hypothetical protein
MYVVELRFKGIVWNRYYTDTTSEEYRNLKREVEEAVSCIPVDCLFVCLMVFSASFIDGGKRRNQRKPSTCRKSLTNFIT